MHSHTVRRIVGWLIVVAQVVFWAIPSNVVRLVAMDRATLLGRYSVEKVGGGVLMLLVSIPILLILFAKPEKLKGRIFRIVAVLLVLLPGLIAIDAIGRLTRKPRYANKLGFVTRAPRFHASLTFEDKPEAVRTYPNVKPGYPPIACELNCDDRGFRNRPGIETCDILAIGDSFTEGSGVSDNQCWPAVLAKSTGQTVYNLGMSGANTQEYLLAYERVGRSLKPRTVICMVYEGNDFRGTNINEDREDAGGAKGWRRVEKFFKNSPLIKPGKDLLTRLLGPVNAHAVLPAPAVEAIDWLPLGVGGRHFYAFQPKDLLTLYVTPEAFAKSRGWKDSAKALTALAERCRSDGVSLAIAYAPSKPHVILRASSAVPADFLRAFAALERRDLPAAEQFAGEVYHRLDVMEQQTEALCRQEKVQFVRLTHELVVQSNTQNRQVYFSYDQHWTPDGHAIVAERLQIELLLATSRPSE